MVRRKAAGTIKVHARGRSAHSGSAPERGRNALLALAAAAQAVAARHAPDGPERLTAVPTVLHAGEAFNVVPGRGELSCDLRADSDAAILGVLDAHAARRRRRHARAGAHAALAGDELGGRDGAAARARAARRSGGRWSACAAAAPATPATSPPAIPLTVDGLGPRGGKAHNPGEYVLERLARDPRRGRAGGDRRGAARG